MVTTRVAVGQGWSRLPIEIAQYRVFGWDGERVNTLTHRVVLPALLPSWPIGTSWISRPHKVLDPEQVRQAIEFIVGGTAKLRAMIAWFETLDAEYDAIAAASGRFLGVNRSEALMKLAVEAWMSARQPDPRAGREMLWTRSRHTMAGSGAAALDAVLADPAFRDRLGAELVEGFSRDTRRPTGRDFAAEIESVLEEAIGALDAGGSPSASSWDDVVASDPGRAWPGAQRTWLAESDEPAVPALDGGTAVEELPLQLSIRRRVSLLAQGDRQLDLGAQEALLRTARAAPEVYGLLTSSSRAAFVVGHYAYLSLAGHRDTAPKLVRATRRSAAVRGYEASSLPRYDRALARHGAIDRFAASGLWLSLFRADLEDTVIEGWEDAWARIRQAAQSRARDAQSLIGVPAREPRAHSDATVPSRGLIPYTDMTEVMVRIYCGDAASPEILRTARALPIRSGPPFVRLAEQWDELCRTLATVPGFGLTFEQMPTLANALVWTDVESRERGRDE